MSSRTGRQQAHSRLRPGRKFDPKIFENFETATLTLDMVVVGSFWFGRKCVGKEEAKVGGKQVLG